MRQTSKDAVTLGEIVLGAAEIKSYSGVMDGALDFVLHEVGKYSRGPRVVVCVRACVCVCVRLSAAVWA